MRSTKVSAVAVLFALAVFAALGAVTDLNGAASAAISVVAGCLAAVFTARSDR